MFSWSECAKCTRMPACIPFQTDIVLKRTVCVISLFYSLLLNIHSLVHTNFRITYSRKNMGTISSEYNLLSFDSVIFLFQSPTPFFPFSLLSAFYADFCYFVMAHSKFCDHQKALKFISAFFIRFIITTTVAAGTVEHLKIIVQLIFIPRACFSMRQRNKRVIIGFSLQKRKK